MKFLFTFCFSIIFSQVVVAQQKPYQDEFAHTFSILARDAETGEMAVGVQSHWFSVGTAVPWAKSGVGVVATQSFVSKRYGYEGIELLEKGYTPEKALNHLLKQDQNKAYRQVAMLNNDGKIAVHTGEKCVESAGHKIGDNFVVQANMMLNDEVIERMYDAYKMNLHLPLAERVMSAMHAAQGTGGDIRGKQSAALVVVSSEKPKNPWDDRIIDLRVDDHQNPIKELDRLLNVHRAYEFMNKGDVAMENQNTEAALDAYGKAEKLLPNNTEMKFWKAVALVNSGDVKKAVPLFERIFSIDKNWQKLLERLPKADLLNIQPQALNYLLEL
ncbi:DUF1028 domain-containing protein [Psychroflexus halocasei]|uniref:Uncharacterized conserved protein, Ntn-hydrolase superfamily n=1 Tax=Psychroflexus halocasei TaxID=908615 RepID=A0A1H4DGY5_9FLAO|nr:DUF1028 domain-containing protein [Psychroflexus halocasei]SEA72093.1 Uncharacterized conserved protein, Ntn-hydrolase superfamily [Psychroflexus halocasei]